MEPLCARSLRAPGQSGMSSTWYLAPGKGQQWSNTKHHQATHICIPTVYRFQFGRCSVGFDAEVLHPSGGAFVHAGKIYRLSLQAKMLRSSYRSTMDEAKNNNQYHNPVKGVGLNEKNMSHSWCGGLKVKQRRTMIETLLERLGGHP